MPFEWKYERSVPERRPPGHQPAAPRYSLRWTAPRSTLVSAYFGMQAPPGAASAAGHIGRMRGFLAEAHGPQAQEVMRCTDEAGLDNTIVVAYWTDPGTYAHWLETSGFRPWFDDPARLTGDIGYWFEALVVPYDRHETIYSAPGYRIGLARTPDAEIVPITTNGYFGAARDRLPLSAIDTLESPSGGLFPPTADHASRGAHLCALLPHNATVLRSGQFWEGAGREQLDDYMNALQPKLLRGMAYLVEQRERTGCLSLRIMTNLNEDGSPRAETSVYAAFLSLNQLEAWAESHDTHLEIYRHAIAMNRLHKEKREVVTWHELFVPGMGNLFEYVNCHPRTGILPYARVMAPVGKG
ncbi:phenylacetaldoxime dehydratase family protein [Achromobacter aloeverae]|uniref:Phenylacetaldoxime dehydratase n=1 Tax=Achromobacter aloeverae TaxID=1750518 RepID=A0A4Q1HFI1_9BURK|nr:phenylacetaldoxime dehydratase family protein [Achromobacter aloeverae]RXN85400.1 phenylacetaldoxime dehydratase [Achromobacter aloeverae]